MRKIIFGQKFGDAIASKAWKLMPDRLFGRMPADLDLRDEDQSEAILSTADELLARVDSLLELDEIECLLSARPCDWPMGAHVAVKLARSKGLLATRRSRLHLSVVVPVYQEHLRLQSPGQHPLGERCLDRKLRELDWLLGGNPDQRFELLIVDDGCPDQSGRVCEDLLAERHPGAPARVLYLDEAIRCKFPVAESLTATDESQKGGAIQFGLWEATREPREGHVVLYTDADLSTHLGQSGLLVNALDAPGISIAAGSRRARESVVVKSARRSARGRLFIYLWKKLLPELGYLEDTQCGFKAMPADVARRVVERPTERGFAFDLEMLLRCELVQRRSTAPVPITWIDSQAASTTIALAPYLPMLRSIVRLYRTHSSPRETSEAFANAIEALDEISWQRATEFLGPRLEPIDPALDRDNTPLSPSDLVMSAA